ncbi:uncharacterized protein LOC116620137 [Nematostella vectensis]|uniref:uncharacterized protein LOC116620137 n=1 Tax=Nematostella vectensis TaxID=45351 RepID=UPI00207713B1|nr:uncharacterized protein LOC116620137 [Nematostella vectensis]
MKNYLLFVFLFSILKSCCLYNTFTVQNAVSARNPLGSYPAIDWLECLNICSEKSSCISYNFRNDGDEETCILYNYGFQNACEAKEKLIFKDGFVFQQIREEMLEDIFYQYDPSERKTSAEIEQGLILSISCSQAVLIYVDDKQVGKSTTWCNRKITQFIIPEDSRMVALEGVDFGRLQPGIIASLGNQIVTDSSWKCSVHPTSGWTSWGFNDALWPAASVYWNLSNPIELLPVKEGLTDKAEWIWTADTNSRHVYCRRKIR